ncbi:MAG: FRG domain-containing protein [Liquorilactobacillus hordei]|uniref:FRG domain-containing protein n=1 Tax=Liquorilactobacillus hordei TaxID=468911 RepID=UPI0039E95813
MEKDIDPYKSKAEVLNIAITDILCEFLDYQSDNYFGRSLRTIEQFSRYLVETMYFPLYKNGYIILKNNDISTIQFNEKLGKMIDEDQRVPNDLFYIRVKNESESIMKNVKYTSYFSVGLDTISNDEERVLIMRKRALSLFLTSGVQAFMEEYISQESDSFTTEFANEHLDSSFPLKNRRQNKYKYIPNDYYELLEYIKKENKTTSYDMDKTTSYDIQNVNKMNKIIKNKKSTDAIITNEKRHSTLIIESVSQLVEVIANNGGGGNSLRKFGGKSTDLGLYFRGHANCRWGLAPSIQRSQKLMWHENDIYEQSIVLNSEEFKNIYYHLDILTKMQHYSVPTRLLDITKSLAMAIFFACDPTQGSENEYGEIIVFRPKGIKYFRSDNVSILSSLPTLPQDRRKYILELAARFVLLEAKKRLSKQECIDRFNNDETVKKLLHELNSEKNFSNVIKPSTLMSDFFVQPILDNKRIINQQGAFVIRSLNPYVEYVKSELKEDKTNLDCLRSLDDKRLKDENGKIVHYIIPDKFKPDLLKFISILGTNKSIVYPEIEKTAAYIKENNDD